MNLLLAQDRSISVADMGQLHDDYLADTTQSDSQLDDISQAIQTKVAGAQSLVTEVISNTTSFVSTMEKAKLKLRNASS
ncbi:MAG: hypothetical protein HRT81_08955, partial [Henriciella sp.]|nr:hypothetical protein [Henriciella sp.]